MPERAPEVSPLLGPTAGCITAGWRVDWDAVSAGIVEVVRAAVGATGVRERPPGSNRSPEIDRWTGMVGLPGPGPPWCAYALSAWYARADSGCPWGRLGSAFKLLTWAQAHRRIIAPAASLRPGDVALRLGADLHGHVELVVASLLDDRIATVAGNVASAVRGLVHARAAFTTYFRPVG